jgi:hypothetical protein
MPDNLLELGIATTGRQKPWEPLRGLMIGIPPLAGRSGRSRAGHQKTFDKIIIQTTYATT